MRGEAFVRGAAKITVWGKCENIINRVADEDVLLWGAEEKEGEVSFYVRRSSLGKVLDIFPEAKYETLGLPKKIKKAVGRRALICALSVMAFLWLLSGAFVWEITVEGNTDVTDAEILKVLRRNGVTYGTLGISVDSEKLSNVMLCEIPELSWFAINITGCRAKVLVRERVAKPEIVKSDEKTDVYAKNSGVIMSMDVYDGTPLVKVGDKVSRGQMLISGISESVTGFRTEHALGKIYAQTEYELTASMPQKCVYKEYTGETKSSFGIKICSRVFALPVKCGYENYDKTVACNQLSASGGKLPVSFIKTEYAEFVPVEYEMNEEYCEKILKAELSSQLKSASAGDVISAFFDTQCENGVVSVTLYAVVYERIG